MKKKKQSKPREIRTRAGKGQRGNADEAWERLMRIRANLGKTASPAEKSDDEVWESLMKSGEEISKAWQSEKSAVEILSEMRR